MNRALNIKNEGNELLGLKNGTIEMNFSNAWGRLAEMHFQAPKIIVSHFPL